MLITCHCPHSPTAAAAFNQYHLTTEPTAANLQQWCVAARWGRQTDGHCFGILCGQYQQLSFTHTHTHPKLHYRHNCYIQLCSPVTKFVTLSQQWNKQSKDQCFFVTVRAGTSYRKIWRLVTNFFARIIRFTVQKFQLFWVIFCIIIFFIELWRILILWLAKMPNGGMPVFTLIATGWRYRKIFFYKKALVKTRGKVLSWEYRSLWKWNSRPSSTPTILNAHSPQHAFL